MSRVKCISLISIITLCAVIILFSPKWPSITGFSDVGVAYSAYPPPSTPTASDPYPPPGSMPKSSISTAGDSSALLIDAKVYASMNNVSIDEALRRLKLQDKIGELNDQLAENEKGTFAGLWIEHQPDYRVIVRLTKIAESVILPYIEDSSLANIVELSPADVSLEELEESQSQVAQISKELGFPFNSSINVKENFVELYVTDPPHLEASLQAAQIQLPANVQVVKVSELPKEVQDIYGGVKLDELNTGRYCTSGFSVINGNGVKGITTAGHCPNNLYFGGILVPFMSGTPGGNYDIQWNRGDQSFVVKDWMFDGNFGRSILNLKFWENQVVGDFVCKYGVTTSYGCAYIGSTTFNGVDVVVYDIVVAGGDSGGPWFLGNTAYGTTIWSCELDNGDPCAIYGPVDHIYNILNLKIFMNQIYLPLMTRN
jgi:hypothetical protein